jgi:hypothetical protein
MQLTTDSPSSSKRSFEYHPEKFLVNLLVEHGTTEKNTWSNNNSTLHHWTHILDLEDIKNTPSKIFASIFFYNQVSGRSPIIAVPVAGWRTEIEDERCSCLSIFSRRTREDRLVAEYAKSFSLSSFTTAKNADLILRISKAAQRMEVFTEGNERLFRVTAGVRITDADAYLHKLGLALPPNMPTLHVASLVGAAANGCYGPGRDYGPMTTNIVQMKVINAFGKEIVLSQTENSDLFRVLRDCHMGSAGFVSEITLKNIETKFLMRRHNTLYKDVLDFETKMHHANRLNNEHFMIMYIPVDIEKKDDNYPRIRVTTFERTHEAPRKETKCREHENLTDYLNLMTTEAGEPLIDLVTKSEILHPFLPFILKTAALKTYGVDEETVEVDWSASIAHVFKTYTDLPICDINWLIQVNSADEARHLLTSLLHLIEDHLKVFAGRGEYPLFNAFARYLKGVYYPEGEGGVTPTATDQPHQSILSFELISYSPLAETKAFKFLVS